MDTTHLRRLAALPLLVAVLALAGCSGGDSDSLDESSGGGVAAGDMEEQAPAAAQREAGGAEDSVAAEVTTVSDRDLAATPQRSVISKGVVSLTGDDVAGARFDVQKVVDGHDGDVTEEKNHTDEDGEMTNTRLVVRVPVTEFDAAMSELEKVAQLATSSRNSEDVTTEVIDTEVRIRAQTESLKRVELLLARAQSIRDIVSIEAQLTRRQAELDSLKARQAYLADQTSISTITVFLEKTPLHAKKKAEEDDSGFLAGLGSGWDGMTTFLVGLATLIGLLLPFAVLVLVLGVPTWLLVRSLLRRRPSPGVGQTG